jgi:hypothetical protein
MGLCLPNAWYVGVLEGLITDAFLKARVYYLGKFKRGGQGVKQLCFGMHLGMENVLN